PAGNYSLYQYRPCSGRKVSRGALAPMPGGGLDFRTIAGVRIEGGETLDYGNGGTRDRRCRGGGRLPGGRERPGLSRPPRAPRLGAPRRPDVWRSRSLQRRDCPPPRLDAGAFETRRNLSAAW